MERPVNIKEDIWQFLLKRFEEIPDDKITGYLILLGYRISLSDSKQKLLKKISYQPAAFLWYIGLLEQPDLLKNVILGIITDKSLNIEIEHVITEEAVADLKEDKEFIILDRLGGRAKALAITKQGLAENLARHCTIDYLEEKGRM